MHINILLSVICIVFLAFFYFGIKSIKKALIENARLSIGSYKRLRYKEGISLGQRVERLEIQNVRLQQALNQAILAQRLMSKHKTILYKEDYDSVKESAYKTRNIYEINVAPLASTLPKFDLKQNRYANTN